MRISPCRAGIVALILSFILSTAFAQDVLTYHNNNSRTGLYNKETILTPANVNVASFGKLFTVTVDGKVDAQPLYLSRVNTATKGLHNLLIVATEHDSLYAFDADNGALIWHISALKAGETPSDPRGCNQVTPEIGISATPVVRRPVGSNGIIYIVAMSLDNKGNYHQRLHAIAAASGNELNNGPAEISAKFKGTGDNTQNGFVVFDPAQYKERSGLLLIGNTIYLAWASHCDIRPYTGWIMAYNGTTLAQTSVLNVTPNGNEGAIWGAGGGLAADGQSNIYFLDANGEFDETLNASGFPNQGDYGNAFMKLTTKGGLAVTDYFEMSNEISENSSDTDLGSGAAMLLPAVKDGNGTIWNLAVGAGKDGNLYVVNRANMGKFNTSKNNIYQPLNGVLPGGIWSMPAYYSGRIYYGPVGAPILAFQIKSAKLTASPVAHTPTAFGYPGATPSISANGTKNAIVWASENTIPAILHAYNALTLNELYNSNQASGGRDQFGSGNKFVIPTIANGKVYIPTQNGVGVFGLLPK